jgi:hypothetical protein
MKTEKIPTDNLRKEAFHRMLTAGMNLRYRQYLSSSAGTTDLILRVVTALATSGAIASSPIWNLVGNEIFIGLSFLAAISSVCLAVVPLKKWETDNNKLVESWTALRDAWERIFDQTQYTSQDFFDASEMDRLRSDQAKIEKDEHTAPWAFLLNRAQQAERCSHGLPAPSKDQGVSVHA